MSAEREQIVNLTTELVKIPSVSIEPKDGPEDRLRKKDAAVAVLNLVSEYLTGSDGITSETFESNGVVSRLWGSKETFLKPKLLLSGHIDVVNAPTNFFTPKLDKDKLVGRGTGDMKGHVAAMVMAYKKWILENKSSNGVGLLLTSDEEVGGFNGTRYVIEKGLLKPSVVFIPDGEFSFNIVDSQKAPHHFHVKAISKDGGGHVSRAFKIDNPVNHIVGLYQEMRKKYALATPDDDWQSTFEMTVFSTGNGQGENISSNSANQIAEWAEAWLGWRWPLEVKIDGKLATYETGMADLKDLAEKYGVEILKDEHGFGEGCYTDPTLDSVKQWIRVIEPIIQQPVYFQHMHGATDGRHFYKYGSEVLVTSAITGGAHSDHEWVDIDSLVKLSEAIYKYQKVMIK